MEHDLRWASSFQPERRIIAILNREIVKIIGLPDMQDRAATLGLHAVGTEPEEFATPTKVETEK
jgi:hypothetical protein